jgi:hypothetical protein
MRARILEIYNKYGDYIVELIPLRVEEEYLKIVIRLPDNSTLRVTEEWQGARLVRYSYFWLTPDHRLKTGWDNAPHHKHLETFPHHKHVGWKGDCQNSEETCLEDVMDVILKERR